MLYHSSCCSPALRRTICAAAVCCRDALTRCLTVGACYAARAQPDGATCASHGKSRRLATPGSQVHALWHTRAWPHRNGRVKLTVSSAYHHPLRVTHTTLYS